MILLVVLDYLKLKKKLGFEIKGSRFGEVNWSVYVFPDLLDFSLTVSVGNRFVCVWRKKSGLIIILYGWIDTLCWGISYKL